MSPMWSKSPAPTGRRVYTYGFNEGCDVRITVLRASRHRQPLHGGHARRHAGRGPPSSRTRGRHNVLNAAGVVTLAVGARLRCGEGRPGACGLRRRPPSLRPGRRSWAASPWWTTTRIIPPRSPPPSPPRQGLDYQPCARAVPAAPLLPRAPVHRRCSTTSSAAAFDKADSVTFMDVYPAGEAPVPGVSGKTFLNVVLEHEGHPQADFVPRRVDVVPASAWTKLQPGDLVITMGAGDVTAIGPADHRCAPRGAEARLPCARVTHARRLRRCSSTSAFDGDVYPDEPMRRHTMYRIGGPGALLCAGWVHRRAQALGGRLPSSAPSPWVAVGRGSNLLVSDEGFPGVVIALGRDFRACRFDEETCSFIVGAGVLAVKRLCRRRSAAAFRGLSSRWERRAPSAAPCA